jgi:hypothetical protein
VIDQELADIQTRLKELDSKASKASEEDQKESFTGVVLVVLESPNHCSKVLTQQEERYCRKFMKNTCSCFIHGTSSWTFERAPEPTDIFWENMNVHFCKRVANSMFSWLLTLIMAGICFFFIQWIKSYQDTARQAYKQRLATAAGKSVSLYDKGKAQTVSIIASVAVIIVNGLLVFVMRRFSTLEEHSTLTNLNVSVAVKLTIARFLNSSLVLLFVNDDPLQWFKNGNLAYDATILIALLAVQAPLKTILWPWGLIKKIKVCLAKRKGEDCKLTQREANTLMEGTTTDVASSISEFVNMIMTCVFYSPILPQAIPAALIGSFLSYWSLKY